MFSIFCRKKKLSSEFFKDFQDHHAHVLPMVDDGVRSVDKAFDLLAWYERLGVKKVYFTSHIMEDLAKNDAEFLRGRFEDFKKIYKGKIELSLAAEYMLDSAFYGHLKSGDMLTLFGNYLLVETSYMSAPANVNTMLEDIHKSGYHIILAHPERYIYMNIEQLLEHKEKFNLKFQLNLLSMAGYYGGDVKKTALYLLDNGYYDLIGSDIHSLGVFENWMKKIKLTSKQYAALVKLKGGFYK